MITTETGSEIREVRLVGRGGQGVVTAGDIAGQAALREGRWAQSIPSFGPERRGALCASTLRIAAGEIHLRCGSLAPDVLLVIDPTIWRHANVFAGLREGGAIVMNSAGSPEEVAAEISSGGLGYRFDPAGRTLATVDATRIALEAIGRPIPNTAMLGAFSGVTGLVGLDAIEAAFQERFGERAPANARAARAARAAVRTREV